MNKMKKYEKKEPREIYFIKICEIPVSNVEAANDLLVFVLHINISSHTRLYFVKFIITNDINGTIESP